jgi:hypothetical protein
LAYNWKEKLNGNYKEFAKPEEIPPIIQFMEQQSEWLYDEGLNSTRGIYN